MKNNIKGVIFDKDGTLLKFTDIWRLSLEELFDYYELSEADKLEIRQAVGVNEDHSIRENSILASGTIADLAEVFSKYVDKSKEALDKEISDFFLAYLSKHPELIVGTCDVKKCFDALKKLYIKVAVITADSFKQAKLSFEMLGVFDEIDFLAAADFYPNKPDPSSLDAFCKDFGLSRKEVAVVGDSLIDLELGKVAGLAVGVTCGVGTKEMLMKDADIVLDTPLDLINVLR